MSDIEALAKIARLQVDVERAAAKLGEAAERYGVSAANEVTCPDCGQTFRHEWTAPSGCDCCPDGIHKRPYPKETK